MKHINLTFFLAIFCCYGFSQEGKIKGTVTTEGKPIPFANIGLLGTSIGTAAGSDGTFILKSVAPGEYTLEISAVGYNPFSKKVTVSSSKTLVIDADLKPATELLNEIVVTGTMKKTYLKDSPIKVEVLTPRLFQSNPTNNIIEAIETVNGVQEQINCGVCATNDIHINGMEGPYTLVMIDGMPIVSALASVYGFNGIPTNLIKQVEIVKGPASSLYGTEAVGGVINIITQDPEDAPKVALNSFYTSHQESNTDLSTSFKLGKKAASLFSANYYNNQYRMDFNNDNFTDIPLNNRISIFNKWSFKRKNNRVFDLAGRVYLEDRFGGVMNWDPEYRGSDSIYGESIYTKRYELIGSYQLPVNSENIRLDFSWNNHRQNSYYGDMPYIARQEIFFTNLIWDKTAGSHDLIAGGTFRYQIYNDNTPATPEADHQPIPGLFLQDEYTVNKKISILGGGRVDYHKDHDFVLTPRLAFKWKPSTWTTFRLNGGKGFRVVNLFTEDHAALTGARRVVIAEKLQPEQSYNVNLNYNQVYNGGRLGIGSLDFDLFYTYFMNKIVPDYDTDPNLIVYSNLGGHAIVRGGAMAFDHSFSFPLKLKAGVTYQDVFNVNEDENGETVNEPQEFAPKFSGTFVASYSIKKLRTTIDYTGKIVGPQHLPTFPEPYSREETSPWYTLQNIKVMKTVKKNFDLYIGVKNLFNYTQPTPLIDPENPFGDYFDTVYAYGPLQTRRYYFGISWKLP